MNMKIKKAEWTGWNPGPGIRITWVDGTVHWIKLDEWNSTMQKVYSSAHNLVFI